MQLSVAVELLNRTVPELCTKEPPVTVKAPWTIVVPLLAVNVPPDKVYDPNVRLWLPVEYSPLASENVLIVNVLAWVIVPEYPAEIVMTVILAGAVASMVEFLLEVPSKITVSAATGQISLDQLAHVLQLLSAPPPSQVRVAAPTGCDKIKKLTTKPAKMAQGGWIRTNDHGFGDHCSTNLSYLPFGFPRRSKRAAKPIYDRARP